MTPIEKLEEEYLTEEEVAKFLGISIGRLRNVKGEGKGPLPTKVGRRILYSLTEVRRWLKDKEAKPVAPPRLRRV
jgi:predicted DNA-binding transcriptional regulator AlpA